jgi:hypothetical protein
VSKMGALCRNCPSRRSIPREAAVKITPAADLAGLRPIDGMFAMHKTIVCSCVVRDCEAVVKHQS